MFQWCECIGLRHILDFINTSDILLTKLILANGPIAQLAEQPAHNRSVPGSNPGGPTKLFRQTNLY